MFSQARPLPTQWFPCPGCDKMVCGQVLGTGPKNVDKISRTHCCLKCANGSQEHEKGWCSGVPGAILRTVQLEGEPSRPANFLLYQPENIDRPAPAVLYLHGAFTYIWPEEQHKELDEFRERNPASRGFWFIVPLAIKDDPCAVVHKTRTKADRYGNPILYVDDFNDDLVWELFMTVCKELGSAKVDFSRLSIMGISMGAQATWNLAVRHGSHLSAIVPMAGKCSWKGDWAKEEESFFGQVKDLNVRAYAGCDDTGSFSVADFQWMASKKGLPAAPTEQILTHGGSVTTQTQDWGPQWRLTLLGGKASGHVCWDPVLRTEELGLFQWLRSVHRGVPAPPELPPRATDEPMEACSSDREHDRSRSPRRVQPDTEPALQWFQCPGCDMVVTGQVLGTGPKNQEAICRTHCCKNCAAGNPQHGHPWCAGVPGAVFRSAPVLGGSRTGHYLLFQPEEHSGPAPAVLFLHGAMTYVWPETLYKDVCSFRDVNAIARRFVIVVPFAAKEEPAAVVSIRRTKEDRRGNVIPYVEEFNLDVVWELFLDACRSLGSQKVDFSRLSAMGFSMGGQATWDLAVRHGSSLAAIAPMAARCSWKGGWGAAESFFLELKDIDIRAFSGSDDKHSFALDDFSWIATKRGESKEAQKEASSHGSISIETHVWGNRLQLCLLGGGLQSNHVCWPPVLKDEDVFGLFTWLARTHCAGGGPAELASPVSQ